MHARTIMVGAAAFIGIAVTGCDDDRDRPGASELGGPSGPVHLEAIVRNPSTHDIYIVGRAMTVTVEASEPSGQLFGVGYVVRRIAPGRKTLDSAAVMIDATARAIIPFSVAIPDSMPDNSQLNVIGIAFGPGTVTARSEPQTALLLRCGENARFC